MIVDRPCHGDLLVLGAQFSYALFLSLFNKFIKKYSIFTVNKWMFLWATIIVWPFTGFHVSQTEWAAVNFTTWMETAYVVVFGTFLGYILIVNAQKVLRPTVVAIYNYVQPLVAVIVSLAMGIGVVKWSQGLAVLFVFAGVWMVTKSKSRRDMLEADKKDFMFVLAMPVIMLAGASRAAVLMNGVATHIFSRVCAPAQGADLFIQRPDLSGRRRLHGADCRQPRRHDHAGRG